MNESEDRMIKLLEEIRDIQIKQAEHSTKYMEYMKKAQEEYAVQLKKYQDDQDAFRKSQDAYQGSQDAYQKGLPGKGMVVAILLGIIAICMMLDLFFRIIGK